jgi:hypothetical protein
MAACSLLLLFTSALAEHLPEALLARGKPESSLAGINLKRAKLADVVRMYGPATRRVTAPNNPDWIGYVWEKSAVKLEIGFQGPNKSGVIDSIYVQGMGGGPMGTTGAGLKLGDSIETLKRIYGPRFQETKARKVPQHRKEFMGMEQSHLVTLQWKSLEFTLMAGLNSSGKIEALQLMPPECYPGDCE